MDMVIPVCISVPHLALNLKPRCLWETAPMWWQRTPPRQWKEHTPPPLGGGKYSSHVVERTLPQAVEKTAPNHGQ